jgi:hypothetical protein
MPVSFPLFLLVFVLVLQVSSVITLQFFWGASLTQLLFFVTRRLPRRRLLETIETVKERAAKTMRGETMTEWRRSRPSRCERVCMSFCGHCEAVQVPVAAQEHRNKRAHQEQVLSAVLFSYRVNGITNYKPLSWKCKCGGVILDPCVLSLARHCCLVQIEVYTPLPTMMQPCRCHCCFWLIDRVRSNSPSALVKPCYCG